MHTNESKETQNTKRWDLKRWVLRYTSDSLWQLQYVHTSNNLWHIQYVHCVLEWGKIAEIY